MCQVQAKARLTELQEDVLKFIIRFRAEKGWPPTRKEISAHFGFKSVNSAELHLKVLKRKGFIAIERGTARGIAVL